MDRIIYSFILMESGELHLSTSGHPYMVRDLCLDKHDVCCAGRVRMPGGGAIGCSGFLPNVPNKMKDDLSDILSDELRTYVRFID